MKTMTLDLEGILERFFDEESMEGFRQTMAMNTGKSLNYFLNRALMMGMVLSFTALGIGGYLGLGYLYLTLLCAGALFVPVFLGYFVQVAIGESNRRKKEKLVPDLLLQASVFPAHTPMVKIIKYAGRADFGLLGQEFMKAYLEIQKGTSVVESLEGIKKRNKSRVIDRAINLLVQRYNSGAEMGQIFKETADDILETNSILRERNSALVVERYTLIFAGGIIVPAILGLLVGMITSMDFSIMEGLEFGIAVSERQNILNAALLANQIYIVEYAVLASFFLAMQSGKKGKVLLYAAFLLPISIIIYNLAKGF